ncbi:MAG: hypothetical protein [Bacteriophage sp.]|nr:MAG: hypothetical protein [Bacteriophage sp.]
MTVKELIDKLQQFDEDKKIWEGLGFVLQWAKYGLKR